MFYLHLQTLHGISVKVKNIYMDGFSLDHEIHVQISIWKC